MKLPNLTPKYAVGLADKIIGLNKEVIGSIFDRDGLKESGQVQQEKGTAKLSALQSELKAETQKAKVKSIEKTEKADA